MTGLLHILHAAGLGVFLIAACLGSGAVAVRWLGLGAPLALPVGFGCTALAGIAAFCAWWISPAIGNIVSLALGLGAVALAGAQFAGADTRGALRASLPAVVATLLLAGAWLCLLHAAGVPASMRFTHALPVDDQLPRMLADRLAAGNLTGPLAGEWLMSDRPPLQAAVLLLFRPFGAGSGLASEMIATLCQLMWLPALVALGSVLALNRRAIAMGTAFAATSGFFLLNTLYTWPKLMAAALFITAVAAVMDGLRASTARPLRVAVATGALLSLALLAHGGVWFSLLALPALPIAWRAMRWIGVRGVAMLLLVFAFVGAPWTAFKRFVDPPGNRLVKWHLAGAIAVDDRSSLEAIRDAYARTPAADLWHTRIVNAQFVAGVLGRNPDERWDDYIRRLQFFHLVPAVGLTLPGAMWLVLMRLRRGPDEGAAWLIVHAVATVIVWIALLFLPGGAIVHAGSYVPLALLIFLGGATTGRWHAAVVAFIAVLHLAIFLVGWIVTTPSVSEASLNPALMGAFAVLMLGALAALPVLSRDDAVSLGVQGS